MAVVNKIHLEKQTAAFLEELRAKKELPLYALSPEEARSVLEKLQASLIEKPDVDIEHKRVQIGKKSGVSIEIIRPKNSTKLLPPVIYLHGGGWVLGSANTHDRLIREIATGSQTAVIFVNYSPAPEAKFPIALEESYAALKYIAEQGEALNLDTSHIAIAGDSAGGNLAIAVCLLALERKGPKIDLQVLFYPVTNSDLTNGSYNEFERGPWLTKTAMEWFWNAYEPDTDTRKKPLVSPLQAPLEQLKGLPSTLLITAENDVLRDEGEAFAKKLMDAEVQVTSVRFIGAIHDFVSLNALAKTQVSKGAIALANSYLYNALH